MELKSTYTDSPVAKPKRNKYGVWKFLKFPKESLSLGLHPPNGRASTT
jgi:hypothetical protein